VGELGGVARVLEDANAVSAEALGPGQDNGVVVLLELVGSVGAVPVDLVVRVDHVARLALLVKDVGGLGLTVEHPSGFNQMRLKGVNVV